MLHVGHVFGLEKSGAGGREFAHTILDFDVYDPGDTKVVHLEGKDEKIAKGTSMATR